VCFAGHKIKVPSAFVDELHDVSNNALQSAPGGSGSNLQKRNWRYNKNPSDTLALTFALTSKLDQTATVQPDGHITHS
jgi:hypothetical protein